VRQRAVQRLPGRVIGARAQFQRAQSRRLHRQPGRSGYRDLATRLRVKKEHSFRLNGLTSDRTLNALTVYYQEVIANLAGALRTHISATQRLPKLDQAVPLVLSGGTVMPKGFWSTFRPPCARRNSRFGLSEVRLSADPLNSTARGALMAALC